MLDLGELRRHRCAHELRRRVRRDQLGELGLDLAQLPHQRVVLGVGDRGVVVDVVPPVVLLDLGAQVVDPLLDLRGPSHCGQHTGVLWALRAGWLALPLTVGPAIAHGLDSASTPVQVVAAAMAWAAWGAVLVALLVPRTVSLTALRIGAPAASPSRSG